MVRFAMFAVTVVRSTYLHMYTGTESCQLRLTRSREMLFHLLSDLRKRDSYIIKEVCRRHQKGRKEGKRWEGRGGEGGSLPLLPFP